MRWTKPNQMALTESNMLPLGTKAPDFSLPDTVSDKILRLSDVASDKATVIMFLCNHCPYVQRIGDRLASDARVLMAEGINVLAVMSNDYTYSAEDSPEKMKQFAADHGFGFPYLVDESQEVGKAYGAVCTPDFFGLNSSAELQYRGRLDDAKMGNADSRTLELVNAMRLIAQTGSGPEQQIPSMGCSIKWRN